MRGASSVLNPHGSQETVAYAAKGGNSKRFVDHRPGTGVVYGEITSIPHEIPNGCSCSWVVIRRALFQHGVLIRPALARLKYRNNLCFRHRDPEAFR